MDGKRSIGSRTRLRREATADRAGPPYRAKWRPEEIPLGDRRVLVLDGDPVSPKASAD